MPPSPISSTRNLPASTRGVEAGRSALIERKLDRARAIAQQLAAIPFIRFLALGNSVAMGTATELSDLDFFVVTAPNRLWTARFFLLLVAKFKGLTKRPGRLSDQADFGFWVDETALDLSAIALLHSTRRVRGQFTRRVKPDSIDDPYLVRWLATMVLLLDRGGVYKRLMMANRPLLQTLSPAVMLRPSAEASQGSFAKLRMTVMIEGILGSVLGAPLERLLFTIQRWKVWADPVAHRRDPLLVNGRRVDVVTTRTMLKLHHFDQRAKLREQWRFGQRRST